MMKSNYSVVVVSWDLSCEPVCIISSSVWMHNKEIGLLVIYVWCSLPHPQTFYAKEFKLRSKHEAVDMISGSGCA